MTFGASTSMQEVSVPVIPHLGGNQDSHQLNKNLHDWNLAAS
ncbi:hypothetical protein SynROS8604_01996 [Synechococcus sp. ROS8604]|nr:hypothetical protein SynROS8604_01996 [Synechococcus sp. ROS8604]